MPWHMVPILLWLLLLVQETYGVHMIIKEAVCTAEAAFVDAVVLAESVDI